MSYQNELVTGPASEIVTVAEAKAHMRVEVSYEDAIIARLIAGLRKQAEARTKRSLLAQTFDLSLDAWPDCGEINPSAGLIPPLASVTWIRYADADRVVREIDPAGYEVKPGIPGRIRTTPGVAWPAVGSSLAPVTVRYVSGYASAADDRLAPAKLWMLLNIGTWYEIRESIITGAVPVPVTRSDSLLDCLKWGRY